MTRQRAAILEVMREGEHHYTADEIFTLAKEKLPSISRATVYNNLHSLEQEQIIRRIDGEGSADRYDKTFIPHGHLYCAECGNILDIALPDFEGEIEKRMRCSLTSYDLRVMGICENCNKNK